MIFLEKFVESVGRFTSIPLSSFITTMLLYPMDTIVKRIQFEGFNGKNELILGTSGVFRTAYQKGIRNLYAGVQYFFIKSLFLGMLQFQLMQTFNK